MRCVSRISRTLNDIAAPLIRDPKSYPDCMLACVDVNKGFEENNTLLNIKNILRFRLNIVATGTPCIRKRIINASMHIAK